MLACSLTSAELLLSCSLSNTEIILKKYHIEPFKLNAFPMYFLRDLESLGGKNRIVMTLPIEEVLQTLKDLITYFQLPDAELEHEEKQIKLRSLKNRQNLFKQEVSRADCFIHGNLISRRICLKWMLRQIRY